VLFKFGIPPNISFILQSHDGMKEYVRIDDGECTDWFEVRQDLQQGCVLAPTL
ncbi:unnamed protein product, partial [Choristocarpus tenellus]